MPTVEEVMKDPEFISLPMLEKQKVMKSIDTDYAALPNIEQVKVLKSFQTPEAPKAGPTFMVPPEGQTFLSQERPIRREASKVYTPLLEGAGFVGAAAAGATTGNPVASALAAGGGYAAGKSTARRIDELTGLRQPQTMGEVATEMATDVPVGAMMEMGGQVANKFILEPALRSVSQKLSKVIRSGIEKGIRPTVVGKQTASQGEAYLERAESGVKSIIANKDNLQLTNKNGDVITGKLPSSIKEFGQSIEQTKKQIFQQYDAMQVKAGAKGAAVDLSPIVKELEAVANDPVTMSVSPAAAKYAKDSAERLSGVGQYTTAQAQDAIAQINTRLTGYYKNPPPDFAEKSAIDNLVNTNLRKSLDDIIEKSTGEGGYQELKNAYGSLKAIEKDVNHRAVVDARKNKIGFFGYADIWTAAEVVSALADPSKLPRAAAIQGAKQWINWVNNPNRIVKSMFSEAESLMSKLPKKVREQIVENIKKETGVYRYEPEFKGAKSARPVPVKTELQPGEAPLKISQSERLLPDQLSTVQAGKTALQRAKEEQAKRGPPLIRRSFTPGSYR